MSGKKRLCLQCSLPLPESASAREKWHSGCFRSWYLARHPEYTPMAEAERKLVNPMTGEMAEVPDGPV